MVCCFPLFSEHTGCPQRMSWDAERKPNITTIFHMTVGQMIHSGASMHISLCMCILCATSLPRSTRFTNMVNPAELRCLSDVSHRELVLQTEHVCQWRQQCLHRRNNVVEWQLTLNHHLWWLTGRARHSLAHLKHLGA